MPAANRPPATRGHNSCTQEVPIDKRHFGRDVGLHAATDKPLQASERPLAAVATDAALRAGDGIGMRGPPTWKLKVTGLRLKKVTKDNVRKLKSKGGAAYKTAAEFAIDLKKSTYERMPSSVQRSALVMGQFGYDAVWRTGDAIGWYLPQVKRLVAPSDMFVDLSDQDFESMLGSLSDDVQSAFATLLDLEEQQRDPEMVLKDKRARRIIVTNKIAALRQGSAERKALEQQRDELDQDIQALVSKDLPETPDVKPGARSGLLFLSLGAERTPNDYYSYYGRKLSGEVKALIADFGEVSATLSKPLFVAHYRYFMDNEQTKLRDLFVGSDFDASADPSLVRMHLSFQEAIMHPQLLSVLNDYIEGGASAAQTRMLIEMRLLACSAVLTVLREARSDGLGKLGADVGGPSLSVMGSSTRAAESYKSTALDNGRSERVSSVAAAFGAVSGVATTVWDMAEFAFNATTSVAGKVAVGAAVAGAAPASVLATAAVSNTMSYAAKSVGLVDDNPNDYLSEKLGKQNLARLPGDKVQTAASYLHGELVTKLVGERPVVISSNVWKTATTQGGGKVIPLYMESRDSVTFLTDLMKGVSTDGMAAILTHPHASTAALTTTLAILQNMFENAADILKAATTNLFKKKVDADAEAIREGNLTDAEAQKRRPGHVTTASAQALARYKTKRRFLEFRLGMTTPDLDFHRKRGVLPVPIFCDPDPHADREPACKLMTKKHRGCARQDISAWLWAHAQLEEELEMWEAERELRSHLVEHVFWKRCLQIFTDIDNIANAKRDEQIDEAQERQKYAEIEKQISEGPVPTLDSPSEGGVLGARSKIFNELSKMTLFELMDERSRVNQMRTRLSAPDSDLHERTKLPINSLFTHYVVDEYEKWLELEASRLAPLYYSQDRMKDNGWTEADGPENIGKNWKDPTFRWEHETLMERRQGLIEGVVDVELMLVNWEAAPIDGNKDKRRDDPTYVWQHKENKKARYGLLSDGPMLRTMSKDQMLRYGWRVPEKDKRGDKHFFEENEKSKRGPDHPQFWWISTVASTDSGNEPVVRQGALKSYLLFPSPRDKGGDGKTNLTGLELLAQQGGEEGQRVYRTIQGLRKLVKEQQYRRRMYKRIAEVTASSVQNMLLAKNPADIEGPVFTPSATQIKSLFEKEKERASDEGRQPCYDIHVELVCKMNENDDGKNHYCNFHMEPEPGCFMSSWLFTNSLSALSQPPTFMQVKNGRPFFQRSKFGSAPTMERDSAQYYMDSGELVQPKLMAVMDLPYIKDIDHSKLKSTNTVLAAQMHRDFSQRNQHQPGQVDYADEISRNFSTSARCEVIRKVRAAAVATLRQSVNARPEDINATERYATNKVANMIDENSDQGLLKQDLNATYDGKPRRGGSVYDHQLNNGEFGGSNAMRHLAPLLRQIAEEDGANAERVGYARKHHARVDTLGVELDAGYAAWNSSLLDSIYDNSGASADPDMDQQVLKQIRDKTVVVPTVCDPRLDKCLLSAPAPIRLTLDKTELVADEHEEVAAGDKAKSSSKIGTQYFGGRRPQAGVMLFLRVGGPGARAQRFVRRVADYDGWEDNDFQYKKTMLAGDLENDSPFADKNITLRVSVMDIADVPGKVHCAEDPLHGSSKPYVVPYGPRPKPRARWMQPLKYNADGYPVMTEQADSASAAAPMRAAYTFPVAESDWHSCVEIPGVVNSGSDSVPLAVVARIRSQVSGASRIVEKATQIFERSLGNVNAALQASKLQEARLESLSLLSESNKEMLKGQLASARVLSGELRKSAAERADAERLRIAYERIDRQHELEKRRQQLRFERQKLNEEEKKRQRDALEQDKEASTRRRLDAAKKRKDEHEANANEKREREEARKEKEPATKVKQRIEVCIRNAEKHAKSADEAAKAIDERFKNEREMADNLMEGVRKDVEDGFDAHRDLVNAMNVELSTKFAELQRSPHTAALRLEIDSQRTYLKKQLASRGPMQRDKEAALEALADAKREEDARNANLPPEVVSAQTNVYNVVALLNATVGVVTALNDSSPAHPGAMRQLYTALKTAAGNCVGLTVEAPSETYANAASAEEYMQSVRDKLENCASVLHSKEQLRLRLQIVYSRLRRRRIAIMKDNQNRLRYQRQFRRERFRALQKAAKTLSDAHHGQHHRAVHRHLTVQMFDSDYTDSDAEEMEDGGDNDDGGGSDDEEEEGEEEEEEEEGGDEMDDDGGGSHGEEDEDGEDSDEMDDDDGDGGGGGGVEDNEEDYFNLLMAADVEGVVSPRNEELRQERAEDLLGPPPPNPTDDINNTSLFDMLQKFQELSTEEEKRDSLELQDAMIAAGEPAPTEEELIDQLVAQKTQGAAVGRLSLFSSSSGSGIRPSGSFEVGSHRDPSADGNGGSNSQSVAEQQQIALEGAAANPDCPAELLNAVREVGGKSNAARLGKTSELQLQSVVVDPEPKQPVLPVLPSSKKQRKSYKAVSQAQLAVSPSASPLPGHAPSAFPPSAQAGPLNAAVAGQKAGRKADYDDMYQKRLARDVKIAEEVEKRIEAERLLMRNRAAARVAEQRGRCEEATYGRTEFTERSVERRKDSEGVQTEKAASHVAVRKAAVLGALQERAEEPEMDGEVRSAVYDLQKAVGDVFGTIVDGKDVAAQKMADASMVGAVSELANAVAGQLALLMAQVDADSVLSIAFADAQMTGAMNIKDALYENTQTYTEKYTGELEDRDTRLLAIQGVVMEQVGACVGACLMAIQPVLAILEQDEQFRNHVDVFKSAYEKIASDLLDKKNLEKEVDTDAAQAYHDAIKNIKSARANMNRNDSTPAAGVVIRTTEHRQMLAVNDRGVALSVQSGDQYTMSITTRPHMRIENNDILRANRALSALVNQQTQNAIDKAVQDKDYSQLIDQFEEPGLKSIVEQGQKARVALSLNVLDRQSANFSKRAAEAVSTVHTNHPHHLEGVTAEACMLDSLASAALGRSSQKSSVLVPTSPSNGAGLRLGSGLGADTGEVLANVEQLVSNNMLQQPTNAEVAGVAFDKALNAQLAPVIDNVDRGAPRADPQDVAEEAENEELTTEQRAAEIADDARRELNTEIERYRAKQRVLRQKMDLLKLEFKEVARSHYARSKMRVQRFSDKEGKIVDMEVDPHEESLRLLEEMWKVSKESWNAKEGDYIAAVLMQKLLRTAGDKLMLEMLNEEDKKQGSASNWKNFLYSSSKGKELGAMIAKKTKRVNMQKVQIVDESFKVRSAYEREVLLSHLKDQVNIVNVASKSGESLETTQIPALASVMKNIHDYRVRFLKQYANVEVASEKGIDRILPFYLGELDSSDLIETMTRSKLHFAALERQQMMARRMLAADTRSLADTVQEAKTSVVTFMKMPTRAIAYFDLVNDVLRDHTSGGMVDLSVETIRNLTLEVMDKRYLENPEAARSRIRKPGVAPQDLVDVPEGAADAESYNKNLDRANEIVATLIVDRVEGRGGSGGLSQEERNQLLEELDKIDLPKGLVQTHWHGGERPLLGGLFLEGAEIATNNTRTRLLAPRAEESIRQVSSLTPGMAPSLSPQAASAANLLNELLELEEWMKTMAEIPRAQRLAWIELQEAKIADNVADHGAATLAPRMRGNLNNVTRIGPFPSVLDFQTQGDLDYLFHLKHQSCKLLAGNLEYLRSAE